MSDSNDCPRVVCVALAVMLGWVIPPALGADERAPTVGERIATAAGVHGGLCVQIGGDDTSIAVDLVAQGRFLVHVLDTDPAVVAEARRRLAGQGLYGRASVDRLDGRGALPYTEKLVNLLVVTKRPGSGWPADQIGRVLCPGGAVVAAEGMASAKEMEAAGLTGVREFRLGRSWLVGVKPRPSAMGQWSHPRHAADGNAVSKDTLVGPPRRVRWVAGAWLEVSGLVSAAGRNFYAGVLARDAFNGLRLWNVDLEAPKSTGPFTLKKLRGDMPPPVTDGRHLFAAIREGKARGVVALDAASGGIVRRYPQAGNPRLILHDGGTLVVADAGSVRGVDVASGRLVWLHEASDPRHVVVGDDVVALVKGQLRRGGKSVAVVLSKATGQVRWSRDDAAWLDRVSRCVYHRGVVAYEVSTFSDDGPGNALHLLSAADGSEMWDRGVYPGMNHRRQSRAMFIGDQLWMLEGGKTYTTEERSRWEKQKTHPPASPSDRVVLKSLPITVAARDIRTGKELCRFPAGLAHCFPPVATLRYLFSGEMDMTDVDTGEVDANRITKAACGRDIGWVPANGLIYVTPKHCVCWPMLRGYAAMAPARQGGNPAGTPVDQIRFVLERGVDPPGGAASKTEGGAWSCYRHDAWRSGSTTAAGPSALKARWSVDLGGVVTGGGPIVDDWRDNPFIKGPITPPVIAGGRVYVARPDAHEVVALDAASGRIKWRYTAGGRIDTPPTIHRGLCLFGTKSGWVVCLRGDDGRMVWRLRAAPLDERIVAYGQLESPWPVSGSVLVVDDVAYFAAGRQSLADGGIFLFAVEPRTGAIRWVHRLNTVPQKGFYRSSGLEFDNFDLLHREGGGVAMSRWVFDRADGAMSIEPWHAFAKLNTGGGEAWVPRGCWSYAPRSQTRTKTFAHRRPLVVFRDSTMLGCTEDKRSIYRRTFDAAAIKAFAPKWITGWAASNGSRQGGLAWRSQRLAKGAAWQVEVLDGKADRATIHAMVLAGDRLYVAGSGGELKVVSPGDGRVLAAEKIPAPTWDGMAVSGGRLYLCTQGGRVMCLGD